MLNTKKGASAISLVLCGVAMAFIVSALIVATNNSAMSKAQVIAQKEINVVEDLAYTKVYTLNEIKIVAKQAFANNYLSLYDNEVDMAGFEALVVGEMQQTIPQEQLDNYNIFVSQDGVEVQHK
jgi:hypothetical protein